MTRRQLRRRARRHPVLVIAAGTLAMVLADVVLHVLGLVLIAAAIAGAGYLIGRHARPVTRASLTTDAAGQLAALTAERDQLRHQLADAQQSATAAWDAAAERPPASRAEPGDAGGKRAAMLADPLGGARPLVGR